MMNHVGFSNSDSGMQEGPIRNEKGLKIFAGTGYAIAAAVVSTGMGIAVNPESATAGRTRTYLSGWSDKREK